MESPLKDSEGELDPSILQKLAYDGHYTEDINRKMRVPGTITVAPQDQRNHDHSYGEPNEFYQHNYGRVNPALAMEVPERIVVSVGEKGAEFSHGETRLPTPSFNPAYVTTNPPVALQTPPRVLTLQERNLDTLDVVNQSSDIVEESMELKNRFSLSDQSSGEDIEDVSLIRKQLFKMHRRISVLESQQEEKQKRDYCIYGITVAFWLINGWFLYNHRRLY